MLGKMDIMDINTTKMTIVDSMNQFAFRLFNEFAQRHMNDSRNMCFAPLEIFNSIVMILMGAKGDTESQIEEMLCVNKFNQPKKYKELNELARWIIKSNHDIMVYGTIIYIDKSVNLLPEYLKKVKDVFDIKPKLIDFNNVDQAVNVINKDAHELTEGLIDGVISQKDIRDDLGPTKLIISNSVFFRGYWLFKFKDIHKEPFIYAGGQKSHPIDMMSHTGRHRYYFDPELKCHTVSIAYSSSDIRMVILLPENETTEAITLVELLDANRVVNLFWKLQSHPKSLCELTIPRFALDTQKVSLQKSVKQMGAVSLYDPNLANLSGMSNEKIHLSKLVHKAFVLCDERGSLSQPTMGKSSELRAMEQIENMVLPKDLKDQTEPVVHFKANHTFVFIILDKITNVVCFTGVFSDPTDILEVVSEQSLTNEEITQLLVESDQYQQKLDPESSMSTMVF